MSNSTEPYIQRKSAEQTVLVPLSVTQKNDFHFPTHLWPSKKQSIGIRIRHPFVCHKCRRFKLKGLHGSGPPKNFCICPSDSQLTSPCISPIRTQAPSGKPSYLIATGRAVYSRNLDFSMTDSAFEKLTRILQSTKEKIKVEEVPKEIVEKKSKKRIIEKNQGVFTYLVYVGNNSNLIRKVLEQKNNWEEGNYSDSNNANFIWHPTSKTVKFRRLVPYLATQVTNHFEFHDELTNKAKLFQNFTSYCIENNLNFYNMMPVTFALDLKSKRFNTQVLLFLSYFKGLKSGLNKGSTEGILMPSAHFIGKNTWIFKPSGYNRGRGLYIFNNPEVLKNLLSVCISQTHEKKNQADSSTFVVQKYIESPFLINSRKFDIRVWVLITHKMNSYFYHEGYLRTSSEIYSSDENTFSDPIVHLTNNAIQKNSTSYSKYEKGNQLSFKDFSTYLDSLNFPKSKFSEILSQIKKIISHTLRAVKKKLNPYNREYCFEIFGYDFIIDSDLNPWLIECNTNPCMELSSPLLERLIPSMLSQAFDLTLDSIFPQSAASRSESDWEFLESLI